jgi:hypothetical protein
MKKNRGGKIAWEKRAWEKLAWEKLAYITNRGDPFSFDLPAFISSPSAAHGSRNYIPDGFSRSRDGVWRNAADRPAGRGRGRTAHTQRQLAHARAYRLLGDAPVRRPESRGRLDVGRAVPAVFDVAQGRVFRRPPALPDGLAHRVARDRGHLAADGMRFDALPVQPHPSPVQPTHARGKPSVGSRKNFVVLTASSRTRFCTARARPPSTRTRFTS